MPAPPTSPVTFAASPPAAATERLESVDTLRGLVMVLMALDHARDFFHFGAIHGLDPLDPNQTTVALYFTRWITHFCAPVFLLLAGVGAFLAQARGRPKRALSWFLVTRGAWLIVLEMTFVQWAGWTFAVNLHVHFALVLWAIGWSMICLAALVHLPTAAVTTFGLVLIAGHNLLDHLQPAAFGAWAPLWQILHTGGVVPLGHGHVIGAGYPLVPWIGVMAAGYGLGAWLLQAPDQRRRRLWRLGAILTAAFFVLRGSNLYGDPRPWSVGAGAVPSLYSFFNCHKYPPSLCYLLMTLGPALLLLAWWDRRPPAWTRPLLVFGRVPMFFYLLHLPLLHGLAIVAAYWRWGHAGWLYGLTPTPPPADAGFGLAGVYLGWSAGVLLLFPLCRWFADLKRRRRDAWLSYL